MPHPSRRTVPWLDGTLALYLAHGPVLDIKAPGDPDTGPVSPGASIATARHDGSLPSGEDRDSIRFGTVFSRDALAGADDPAATLLAWFELLREGGHLVLVLPAGKPGGPGTNAPAAGQDTILLAPEGRALPTPPAPQAPMGMSADDLAALAHRALPAGSFGIVHLREAPARRPGLDENATDIQLVLHRRETPAPPESATPESATPDEAAPPRAVADACIPFTLVQPHPLKTPGMHAEGNLLVRDFAPCASGPGGISRIVVLKLDHHGDFIIGLPALRELRHAYPDAYIRLVCGTWNLAAARTSCVADDVAVFDYFPERAADWTGRSAATGWAGFASAVEGRFDLAIDLRVDEDSRALLGRIDAGLRCGIGSRARYPLLDIALPDRSREPDHLPLSPLSDFSLDADGAQRLAPDAFESAMDVKTPVFHETTLAGTAGTKLCSGLFYFPQGRYSAGFDLCTQRFLPGLRGIGVNIEVLDGNGETAASRVFGRGSIARLEAADTTLLFDAVGKPSCYQFRLRIEGRALAGRLRFGGVRLRRLDANGARLSPSELHVGEKLSLLVALIRQRTLPLAPASVALDQTSSRPLHIVIAPFSNSSVRDWPFPYYASLAGLLTARLDCTISLIGAPAQTVQAAELMDLVDSQAAGRVTNLVGRTRWSEIAAILQSADLVICNNSGVAHQAAASGARTLAIYSASHQPLEWGPRGPRSRAIMKSVACSPCGYEHLRDCVNEHLCMRAITPEDVLAQALALIGGSQ